MRPLRFIALTEGIADPSAHAARARQIEDLGYAGLVIPDHLVTPLSPIPALVAAAAATTTLRVGTLVIDNDFRHPALLAKEVATADVLTGGRFELGIGAGWHQPEYEAAGLTFDRPATRIERLAESLDVLDGCWSGQPFSYQGRHYRIAGLTGSPMPAQRPRPPVLIGGGGRRLLRLAAQRADIVNLSPVLGPDGRTDPASVTRAGIEERLRWLREAAGERFDDLELGTYYLGRVAVGEDRDSAARALAESYGRAIGGHDGIHPTDIAESPMFLAGTLDQIADDIVERQERYGFTYHAIPQSLVDALAPVVAQLAG